MSAPGLPEREPNVADLDPTGREAAREEVAGWLRRLTQLSPDDPERELLRERVVAAHLPYARYAVSRFRRGSEPAEDLLQAAYVGLVKAVNNYDPDHGTAFLGYAIPMMIGEVKRHFRDATWSVRVPRRLKELRADVRSATEQLEHSLGRNPTIAELANHLDLEVDEVLEAMEASNAYTPLSLDVSYEGDDGGEGESMLGFLGENDPGLEGVVNRESLKPLLERLPPRDKRILLMRFFRGMTQAEIGAELGVSQMQVSRLLSRLLGQLREGLLTDQPPAGPR